MKEETMTCDIIKNSEVTYLINNCIKWEYSKHCHQKADIFQLDEKELDPVSPVR